MATYIDLQQRVAKDLRRSNLGPEIADAILDAIRDHGAERFYFNETRTYALPLVADQDEYQITQEFVRIDWISVQIGSVWMRLDRIDSDSMEENFTITNSGQPRYWTYYADSLRFFPTPNDDYSARIAGHYRLTELSANQDSNAWTNAAKNLIRYSALKRLYAYPIRDMQQAQMAEAAEVRELEYLRRETDRRKRSGVMKAYY